MVVVRREDEADSRLSQFLENSDDRFRGRAIEIRRRLVCQDDLRTFGQRASDRHSLPLTTRELGGSLVPVIDEPERFQNLFASFVRFSMRNAERRQEVSRVLEHRERRDEIERLEDEAEIGQAKTTECVLVERRDVFAHETNATLVGAIEKPEEIEESRLARARGADETNERLLGNLKRHALQDGDVLMSPPVTVFDSIDFEERQC